MAEVYRRHAQAARTVQAGQNAFINYSRCCIDPEFLCAPFPLRVCVSIPRIYPIDALRHARGPSTATYVKSALTLDNPQSTPLPPFFFDNSRRRHARGVWIALFPSRRHKKTNGLYYSSKKRTDQGRGGYVSAANRKR